MAIRVKKMNVFQWKFLERKNKTQKENWNKIAFVNCKQTTRVANVFCLQLLDRTWKKFFGWATEHERRKILRQKVLLLEWKGLFWDPFESRFLHWNCKPIWLLWHYFMVWGPLRASIFPIYKKPLMILFSQFWEGKYLFKRVLFKFSNQKNKQ